jgi:xylulokinase
MRNGPRDRRRRKERHVDADLREKPQDAGAVGAALAVPVGLGIYKDYSQIREVVRVRRAFEPDPANKQTYDLLFEHFKLLYARLSPAYKSLNK